MVDRYHSWSGHNAVFECLLKHNSLSHQAWEIDRYEQMKKY